jgi:hypothetical protein
VCGREKGGRGKTGWMDGRMESQQKAGRKDERWTCACDEMWNRARIAVVINVYTPAAGCSLRSKKPCSYW